MFVRELSEIYTKGTFIKSDIDCIGNSSAVHEYSIQSGAADSGFLISFIEWNVDGSPIGSTSTSIKQSRKGKKETLTSEQKPEGQTKVKLSMLAINVSTGEILWDVFTDTILRSELEMRLLTIQPSEFILSDCTAFTRETETIIRQYQKSKERTNLSSGSAQFTVDIIGEEDKTAKEEDDDEEEEGDKPPKEIKKEPTKETEGLVLQPVRIERMDTELSTMMETVYDFFKSQDRKLLEEKVAKEVVFSVGLFVQYLREFSLENSLKLIDNFARFSKKDRVTLDYSTINQLEILENLQETTGSHNTNYTLFKVINHTKTEFGQRLLKKWLIYPLTDKKLIEERQDAVSEIMKNFEAYEKILFDIPDLERGISRIFYHKCLAIEFINIIKSFLTIYERVKQFNKNNRMKSALLNKLLSELPVDCEASMHSWLGRLCYEAAKANDSSELFLTSHLDPYPDISSAKLKIKTAEKKLNKLIDHYRSSLGIPTLKYVTVANEEYLLELTVAQAKHVGEFYFTFFKKRKQLISTGRKQVPGDWVEENKTKQKKRFRTVALKNKLEQLVGSFYFFLLTNIH